MLSHEFTVLLNEAKLNTFNQLQVNKNQLDVQLQTVSDTLNQQQLLVERTVIAATETIESREEQIADVRSGPLLQHQNLLREHQRQGSNSSVALMTVARIAEQKRLIDRLTRDIEQVKLQVSHEAKRMLAAMKEHDRIQLQIDRIEQIMDIHTFLSSLGRTPTSISEHEVETYYLLFERR